MVGVGIPLMKRIDPIIHFWFEGIDDQAPIDRNALPFKKWFVQDKALDEEIRCRFEVDLQKAAEGKYAGWEDSPSGRLALILLFDQFSRNMYRDTEKMFAYDAKALELTMRTIEEGKDKQCLLIHRAFLYLPLMHAEDLGFQRMSVKYYTDLVKDSKETNPENTHYYDYTLKYAREHCDTVTRFGRFPHRDRILGRIVS